MPYTSTTTVTVRSYELDSYGHVNNAVYFQWLEHARSRLLQDKGFNYNNIEQHWGVRFVLVSTSIDFRSSLSLGDEVVLTTKVASFGRTSVTFDQEVQRRAPDGSTFLAASCKTVIVFTDPAMKGPQAIPSAFRELYG